MTCRSLEVDGIGEKGINDPEIEHVAAINSNGAADYTDYLMSEQPMELCEWPADIPLEFESELDKQTNAYPDSTALSSAPPIEILKPTSEPALEVNEFFPDLCSQSLSLPPLAAHSPVHIAPLECADLYGNPCNFRINHSDQI